MTSQSVTFAIYLAIALFPSVIVHEYAHALAADRLGDPTPRRWGRLTLDPRPHIDRFGTAVLPVLLLLLVAVGAAFLPFGYGKPMPYEPSYLRNRERDETHQGWLGLAGRQVLCRFGQSNRKGTERGRTARVTRGLAGAGR